jgi:hypothetical protein
MEEGMIKVLQGNTVCLLRSIRFDCRGDSEGEGDKKNDKSRKISFN